MLTLPSSWMDPSDASATAAAGVSSTILQDRMKVQFFTLVDAVVEKSLLDFQASEWAKEAFCSLRKVSKLNDLFEQCLRLLVMAMLRTHARVCRMPKGEQVTCTVCKKAIPRGPQFLYHEQTCAKEIAEKALADWCAEGRAGAGAGAGAGGGGGGGSGASVSCPLCKAVVAAGASARSAHRKLCRGADDIRGQLLDKQGRDKRARIAADALDMHAALDAFH
jgi:hypothetical protein